MSNINNENKPIILHLTPLMERAGMDRGVLATVRKLKESEIESVVGSAGGSLVNFLHKINVPHVSFKPSKASVTNIWQNTRKVQKIIKSNQIRLIHIHSRSLAWSTFFANKRVNEKVPFVTTFHAVYHNESKIQKFYNSIMIRGSEVIAVSEFVKNHLIQEYSVPENKITVIPRWVDTDYFNNTHISEEEITLLKAKYSAPKSTPIILLPAKLTSWKGHLLLIDALIEIKDLNFYCIMVGNLGNHPDFVASVLKKIKDAKLQSKIQVFGLDEDIRNLYAISDVVLSTSIEPEGFCRTIIEAQAMEKLVVASNIGSTPEIIEDNLTGLCFEAKNIQSLAERLRYALSLLNTEGVKKITTEARKSVVSKFSIDKVQTKLLMLYKRLLT